ncbi:hypothetical protein E4T47_05787 [Aureobasidium subglaciale]|nr:hypothetical protein E4T43_05274 [Aureobasidium subglaciale]KAI5270884.1 hypothetical protein E4T47_05787 [Aureobasidium subglaciale]
MSRSTRSSAAAAAVTPKKTKAIVSKSIKSIKPEKKAIKREPLPSLSSVPESSDDESDQNEPFTAVLTSKLDRIVRKIRCTIDDGTIATRDKKKSYTQTIELTSKKPFSMEPVLMTSGPYAGRHVLVLQPEPDEHEVFPFLRLPAEIRNMIYSLVLERPGHKLYIYGKNSGVINTLWLRDDGVPRVQQHYSSSLMRVNKQINVESTPYLFSRHTFDFSDSTMMQKFLEHIGPERIQSLVAVHVQKQYRTTMRKAYQLLSPAVSLSELKLFCSPYQYHPYNTAFLWPNALLPLVQAWCTEVDRSREDVMSIISMPGAVRGFCDQHGSFCNKQLAVCVQKESAYDEFYKELREEIFKSMDLMEAKKQAIKSGTPVKTRAGRKTKAIDYSGMCGDEDEN